ncbi:Neural Wiskott-Aldrich syndrome protein [Taenia solium]|eukprot:TsM_000237900 transcript=TsM_000237900 gene=TsM_000237900
MDFLQLGISVFLFIKIQLIAHRFLQTSMIISALLTSDEKHRLMEQVSHFITINMAYIALLYKVKNRRWIRISPGVVTLEEDPVLCVVSIGFYDLNTGKRLIKTDLYKEMEYRECGPQFHALDGVAGPLGLAFACPKEAHDLFTSVQAKLNPPPAKNWKFTNMVHWAKKKHFRNGEQANVKFEMSDFQHIKHVGLDSDGKDLKVAALNEELAKELLEALGMTARTENEMAAVCNLIEKCGAVEVQEALEIHNYMELGESYQSGPALVPPPAPPPPPLQQPTNDGRGNLLDSITNFDTSKLKQVRKDDEKERLPNQGPGIVDSIETALTQMLANRRRYLNECDSDEDS